MTKEGYSVHWRCKDAAREFLLWLPNAPITLAVDRWQLKQVFDNLLSNAVSFSPDGGTISWHWQIFRNDAIFQVRDRVPGVSPEVLLQAFTPFYTQRPGGTGLGLAIAKKIILDHRGSLWVLGRQSP